MHLTDYRESCSRDELARLLHHGHWIPVTRGLTQRYVDEHFPGWTWNGLLDVWEAAGVVHRREGAQHPTLIVDCLLDRIHFDGPEDFTVVWIDGSVTTR